MIQVTIDGQTTEVEPGTTILAAAKQAGIAIPTLCHSPLVEAYGVCRVCSVEVDERRQQAPRHRLQLPGARSRSRSFTRSERALRSPPAGARDDARRAGRNVPVVAGPGARGRRRRRRASRTRSATRTRTPASSAACCVRLCDEVVLAPRARLRGPRRVAPRDHALRRAVEPHCVGCTSCAYVCPTGAIQFVDDPNHPVDADAHPRARRASSTREMAVLDKHQCHMREVGTAHLVEVMDDYDLLPVHNYRFGKHPDTPRSPRTSSRRSSRRAWPTAARWAATWPAPRRWTASCCAPARTRGKAVLVDGPEYETVACAGSNMGIFEPWAIIEFNFYCDHYGLDTISFGTLHGLRHGVLRGRRDRPASTPAGSTSRFGEHRRARSRCCTRWRAARASASIVGQGIRGA